MVFELSEVLDMNELREIVEVERLAFQTLAENKRLWLLLFPEFIAPADASSAAQPGISRMQDIHRADPYSHWIKVTETENKCIVGAARWVVAPENPFPGPLVINSFWWPEGEQREFANQCMRQFRSPRYTKMQRPHVFLNICFTHPDYRRRGIGRMLVEWGLKRADELGVDTYVDASSDGKPLYAAYGFRAIENHQLEVHAENASPTWKKLEKILLPMTWTGMLRPAQPSTDVKSA